MSGPGATAARLILSSTAPGDDAWQDREEAPRVDFVELARLLEARLSYPPTAHALLGGLERRLGLTLSQALHARRHSASVWVSLSEGVGLPLATLDHGRTPHVMVAHNLMRPRMRAYARITRSLERIDRILVFSRSHEAYLRNELGVDGERVRFMHDKVDQRFWSAQGAAGDGSVLSVGRERRDYGVLLEAVRSPPVPTVIVASSLWASGGRTSMARADPHVTVLQGVSFRELRDHYDRAAVVVVPLRGQERYAAGVNSVQEAMAMGKAVIVTDTPGIADYVVDGETARVVPPADPQALRGVLKELLADDAERARLGANARAAIDSGRTLEDFLRTFSTAVREVSEHR
jgi:glycosyltransferase involved in cell wall biosynthesis